MKEDLKKLLIDEDIFFEITGISHLEIKYGLIRVKGEDKLSKDEIKEFKQKFDFESSLTNSRNQLTKSENLSLFDKLFSIIFYMVFGSLVYAIFLQIFMWLIDLIFKTQLLEMKIMFTNLPLYYIGIVLGIVSAYSISKDTLEEEKERNKTKVNKLELLLRLRKLFLECENYNQIINSIGVKDQIAEVLENNKDETREEILQGLLKIRNNLIKALKLDRIMRENQDVITAHRESLEITFAELEYLDMANNASQYSEFVDDVLNLGINLNKEFEDLKLM